MINKRTLMIVSTAFFASSISTGASACGMHKTCENAIKGLLDGMIGTSCALAASETGLGCEAALAEMVGYQTLICGGAAAAVGSVCAGVVKQSDIAQIADKTCKPVKGC